MLSQIFTVLGALSCLGTATSKLPLAPRGTISSNVTLSGTPPCDALAASGLGDRLLLPTNPAYETELDTWFSLNARYHPWCLFLPQTTAEVSLGLTTLLNAGSGAGDWHIAVRSGGHGWPGSNNVVNGVTIDLSMMNASSYDTTTNLASVEPGARWAKAYADLQAYNVTVVGGRDGGVGVGGFLLGGGLSFFTPKVGFGCDSVINYEVVLVNGSVVNANASANSDLWRALKGGGSNFGIVTRYDLEAMPTREMVYSLTVLSYNCTDAVIHAVNEFANYNQTFGDNALVTFWEHNPSISLDTVVGVIYVNTVGDTEASTAFDSLEALPAIVNKTEKVTMAEAAAGSELASGLKGVGVTRTFKNDPAILQHCVQLHENFVSSLTAALGANNFTTIMFLQPLPSYLGQLGDQRGGNMLPLVDTNASAVLWTAGVTVPATLDDAALAYAQAALYAMSAQVQAFAKSVGGDLDFVYMNYADASQDPLGSYGAERVQFMREVAAAYDPQGAFQKRVPGGFKIERVA